jgi:hypothetical protein
MECCQPSLAVDKGTCYRYPLPLANAESTGIEVHAQRTGGLMLAYALSPRRYCCTLRFFLQWAVR